MVLGFRASVFLILHFLVLLVVRFILVLGLLFMYYSEILCYSFCWLGFVIYTILLCIIIYYLNYKCIIYSHRVLLVLLSSFCSGL